VAKIVYSKALYRSILKKNDVESVFTTLVLANLMLNVLITSVLAKTNVESAFTILVFAKTDIVKTLFTSKTNIVKALSTSVLANRCCFM